MAINVDDDDKGSGQQENAGSQPTAAPTPAPQQPNAGAAPNTPRPHPGATGNTGSGSQNNQPKTQTTNNNSATQGNRMNISARTNYGYSRAATSQAMRSLVEVTDKIAEGEVEGPVRFEYLGLDGEKEGLLISAMVVACVLRNPGNDQKFVAHHTLLLAATAKGVNAVEMTSPGTNIKYERLVVPADAYDATLRGRLNEVLGSRFPGYQLIDADATVVPADLDLKSEEAVRNVIANATTATSTLLASVIADDAWVLDEKTVQQTFQTEIKSSYAHFTDLAGNPNRGDIVIEMAQLSGKQNQQNTAEFQYNSGSTRKLVTQIFGYIDVVSTPSTLPNQYGYGTSGATLAMRPEELKVFTPRYVITNIDAPEEAAELPIILQGLATTQVLQNDNRWIPCLVQQHKNGAQFAEGGVNIRDLSVLGLEVPVMMPQGYMGGALPAPQRLPLNSATTGDAMLAAAIQTHFHEDLLISMDVMECGASSWISSPFAAAARGDQNAIRDIFQASDLLTGNRFTPIYKSVCNGQMKPPVYNDNMFVNLGFYYSAHGKRDIRDVDYLAVDNATADAEINMQPPLPTINDWSNLQANHEVDPMFRLTETRRIQQRLFENMVITGRAVRVTFNPAFIYALAAAIAEAGLVYETKMGMAQATGNARMVPQYMRNLPTGLGNAGAFAAGGMRRPGAAGVAANSFGRYAHNANNSNAQGAGNY